MLFLPVLALVLFMLSDSIAVHTCDETFACSVLTLDRARYNGCASAEKKLRFEFSRRVTCSLFAVYLEPIRYN